MPKNKDEIARELANSHISVEDSITRVIRIRSQDEGSESEPIKLLEVNLMTTPSGVMPVAFGPSADIPFPSVVVDVTPDELKKIESRELKLPAGWELCEVIFEK